MFLITVVFCSPATAGERSIWIDADPTCGLSQTDDVDDCWAIIAAVRSTDVRVVGLSTVFGNTIVEQATDTTYTLLRSNRQHESDHDLPLVTKGSSRPIRKQRDIPPAVQILTAVPADHRLTILTLGPLTNIAILLRDYPGLASHIDRIVAVAGQRPGQILYVGSTPFLHLHDFNVRKDPDAFDLVLRSGIHLHRIPSKAAQQVVITERDLNALKRQGALDAWIADRSVP